MKKIDWFLLALGIALGSSGTLSVVCAVVRSINEEMQTLRLKNQILETKIELKEATEKHEPDRTFKAPVPEETIKFQLRGDPLDPR